MSELTPITRKEHIMSGTDITPITREEMFLQKIVEGGGGGGGSSLPEYTAADKGKVLTVGEDAENPQTINIVPQQTVVLTEDDIAAELTGYDFSGVSVGDTLTLTVDDHSETVTVITGGGVELAVAATYSVQGGQQTVQIGFITGTGAGFDCLFRGTGGDTATRKPGAYTVSLTKSVPSVAPKWGRGSVNILALSNQAITELQSTFTSTLMSMVSGGKESIVSSETNFSTTDDREAVLAAIENGVNGVISVIDIFGSKLIIPSYSVGENEGSLVFDVPLYTLLQGSAVYRLRITVKIAASLPGKVDKFAYTIAIEQIDYSAK